MKKKITIAILILSILIISTLNTASAQSISPGVSQGDKFEYSYSITWSSTDQNAKKPNYVTELEKIQNFQIKINGIMETTVNAEVIYNYKDGTSKTETGFVDIQSGSIHLPFGYLIIPAHLNVGDKIYPSGGQATIDSASTKSYASGQRHILTSIIETTYDTSYEKKESQFDKTKGIAVEYHLQSQDTIGSFTETLTETIINTNADVWAVGPEPTSPITLPPTPSPTAYSTNQQTPLATNTNQAPIEPSNLLPIVLIVIVVIIILVSAFVIRGKGKKKSSNVDEEFKKYLKNKQ